MKYHWLEYLGFFLMALIPGGWLYGASFIGSWHEHEWFGTWMVSLAVIALCGTLLSIWGQERRLNRNDI